MYYEHGSHLFKLNETFICVHHLFQKDRFVTHVCENLGLVKIFIKLFQFNYIEIILQLRTNKNSPGKVATPWNKIQ